MGRPRKGTSKSSKKEFKYEPPKWTDKNLKQFSNKLIFSDNIMTSKEIMAETNRNYLYSLKEHGYLKQVPKTPKGTFKASRKLIREFKKNVDADKKWKSTGSLKHSNGFKVTYKLMGEQVVTEGRFDTSKDNEERVKALKKTPEFREKANKFIEAKRKELQEAIAKSTDPISIDKLTRELNKITEAGYKGFSAPDTRVYLERQEAEKFVEEMKRHAKTCNWKTKEKWMVASKKLEQVISRTTSQQIRISIEVITSAYSHEQIFSHQAYEEVTEETTLYVPTQ